MVQVKCFWISLFCFSRNTFCHKILLYRLIACVSHRFIGWQVGTHLMCLQCNMGYIRISERFGLRAFGCNFPHWSQIPHWISQAEIVHVDPRFCTTSVGWNMYDEHRKFHSLHYIKMSECFSVNLKAQAKVDNFPWNLDAIRQYCQETSSFIVLWDMRWQCAHPMRNRNYCQHSRRGRNSPYHSTFYISYWGRIKGGMGTKRIPSHARSSCGRDEQAGSSGATEYGHSPNTADYSNCSNTAV